MKLQQGGHGTGKTGNLVLTFSRQGKHREFCCNTGKDFETRKIFFTVFINAKSMFLFTYFQNFLALLHLAKFLILNYCYMNYFYQYIYCTNIFAVLCHFLTSINQTYSDSFKNKLK